MIGKGVSRPLSLGPEPARERGQREDQRERGRGTHRQVPGGRPVRLGRLAQRRGGEPQTDDECERRDRERHRCADVECAEERGRDGESKPPGERAMSPEAVWRESRIDDHEGDQRHEAEQRTDRGAGCEAVAVLERVDQQDRAGHDRQAGDQAADARPVAPRRERRGDDERWCKQELGGEQGHLEMMARRGAHPSSGAAIIGTPVATGITPTSGVW